MDFTVLTPNLQERLSLTTFFGKRQKEVCHGPYPATATAASTNDREVSACFLTCEVIPIV